MTIIGNPSVDVTLRHFLPFLSEAEIEPQIIDLEQIAVSKSLDWETTGRAFDILYDGCSRRLEVIDSVYQRMYLPFSDGSIAPRAYDCIADIASYLESMEGLVVNRPSAASSNAVKAIQLRECEKAGFIIPEWRLIGNHELAQKSISTDGTWINKGCSGFRSRVAVVDHEMSNRFEALNHTPSLFQKRVCGPNVRVHAVGEALHGLMITCESVDYRYLDDGDGWKFETIDIPLYVQLACREYTAKERAQFLGYDFKICERSGTWFFLEANPMPGFDFYDKRCDGKISHALVKLLSGEIQPAVPSRLPLLPEKSLIGNERVPIVGVKRVSPSET